MKLELHSVDNEDVFRDIARINEKIRKTKNGELIKAGTICKIVVSKKSTYVLLRGMQKEETMSIKLDERKRNELGLKNGDVYDFELIPAGVIGQFLWAWQASDPAYRISARLALLSVILGLIGLILGVFSLIK